MKILFLQDAPDTIGGVEYVNKTLAEAFYCKGYEVSIYSMRLCGKSENINIRKEINKKTISDRILGGRPPMRKPIQSLFQLKIINAVKNIYNIIFYYLENNKDCQLMKQAINHYNPDVIIVSYTYLLDAVPKKYYQQTISHMHTSYEYHKSIRYLYQKINKYQKNIYKIVWGTKSTMLAAIEDGILNSTYIYNPIKIQSKEIADVEQNKKAIYIGRLSPEKQVDVLVEMIDELTKENDINGWEFNIYGSGQLPEKTLKIIKDSKQINLCGVIEKPEEQLLQSSILMIASKYESFSLVLFEANECGVPAIAFEFGEPTYEVLKNNVTGIVVPRDNKELYKQQLLNLTKNPKQRQTYGRKAKEHAKQTNINKVIEKWEEIELFNE